MRNPVFGLILIFAAPIAGADRVSTKDGPVSAGTPVLGYAFVESSLSLHAILGVPGASRWSDPLTAVLPEGTVALRVAPGHRWALVLRDGGEAGVFHLGAMTYSPLPDVRLDGLDPVQFSPSATAVVLPSGLIYTGLPGDPVRKGGTAASGDVAVSDSGEVAAIIEGSLVKDGVFLRECTADCRFAYFPGADSRLAVLDQGRLLELATSEARVIAEGLDSADLLFALRQSIWLAAGTGLRNLDRTTGNLIREESLNQPVSRFEALRHDGAVLLFAPASDENQALWMISAEGVRFVPARVTAAKAESEGKE